jgi:hypothetical protein
MDNNQNFYCPRIDLPGRECRYCNIGIPQRGGGRDDPGVRGAGNIKAKRSPTTRVVLPRT